MGADRVLLGSDYPFPLGEERVGSLIRGSSSRRQMKSELLGGECEAGFWDSRPNRISGTTTLPSSPLVGESKLRHGQADGTSEQLTYSSYLKVPELLELQHPQSSPPAP